MGESKANIRDERRPLVKSFYFLFTILFRPLFTLLFTKFVTKFSLQSFAYVFVFKVLFTSLFTFQLCPMFPSISGRRLLRVRRSEILRTWFPRPLCSLLSQMRYVYICMQLFVYICLQLFVYILGEFIVGRVIKAMTATWHPQCFTCEMCHKELADLGFIKNQGKQDDCSSLFGCKECHNFYACQRIFKILFSPGNWVHVEFLKTQEASLGYF